VTAKALTTEGGTWRGEDHDTYVAAPLSHGLNPNSNAAGRRREDDENLVAFDWQSGGDVRLNIGPQTSALVKEQVPAVNPGNAVRRLTPTECCRLQGFPDDWLGPPNEKPDSPRYAALGDAVTVNVAHWIGTKIMEAHLKARTAA
jgi:site-specific DNA-cytosine methylase